MRFPKLVLVTALVCASMSSVLFFFVSCVREDMEKCVQYALTVRVVDTDGNDLTGSGVLQNTNVYLFDESGFVRMVSTGTSADFIFGTNKSATLTLVAWGNVKTDTLQATPITQDTPIGDARLQLRHRAGGGNLPVTDLFYCRKTVTFAQTRGMQESTITLVMSRQVAGLSIRTRYFSVRYPYIGQAYHFIVRGTGNEMDFTGKVMGSEAAYEPPSITDNNGDMYAPLFRIFPTEEGQYIEIDIYRGDEKLYTVTEDNNFNRIYAPAGKQLNVDIDFRYTEVKVGTTITPWVEVTQNAEM